MTPPITTEGTHPLRARQPGLVEAVLIESGDLKGRQGPFIDDDLVNKPFEVIDAVTTLAQEQGRIVGGVTGGRIRRRPVEHAVNVQVEGPAILDKGQVMELAVSDGLAGQYAWVV